MQLLLRQLSGAERSLTVDPAAPLASLLPALWEELGRAAVAPLGLELQLLCAGQPLQTERSCSELGLTDGQELQLLVLPPTKTAAARLARLESGDAKRLSAALLAGEETALTTLELYGESISDERAHALAVALSGGAAPLLATLHLANNAIRDGGARALGEALKSGGVGRLRALYFNTNTISDRGVQGLAESFAGVPELEVLYLDHNCVGEKGARALAEAMEKGALPALRELSCQYNCIGDGGARAFQAMLSKGGAPQLRYLLVGANSISPEAASELRASCRARKVGFLHE